MCCYLVPCDLSMPRQVYLESSVVNPRKFGSDYLFYREVGDFGAFSTRKLLFLSSFSERMSLIWSVALKPFSLVWPLVERKVPAELLPLPQLAGSGKSAILYLPRLKGFLPGLLRYVYHSIDSLLFHFL